jgi:hypothetical protein
MPQKLPVSTGQCVPRPLPASARAHKHTHTHTHTYRHANAKKCRKGMDRQDATKRGSTAGAWSPLTNPNLNGEGGGFLFCVMGQRVRAWERVCVCVCVCA